MLLDHTTTPTPIAPAAPSFPSAKLSTVESPPVPLTKAPAAGPRTPPLWLFGAAAAVLGWAFFPTLDWLVGKWWNDPSYSHGFLVPLAAAFIVYRSRSRVTSWFSAPQPLVAGGLLAVVLALRGVAGGLLFHQLDALALILSVAAGVLAVGGWRLVKNCWQGLAFLVFMVPLTYEMEQNLGGPLKTVATVSSTYLLQTVGLPAVVPGNAGHVIHIDDVQLGVADACNGLKMLLTFAAIGGGAVFLLRRGWFERLMVVLGVVPIAVLANVLRIAATGVVFYLWVRDPHTQHAVHDGLGYVMPVIGVGLLCLELWVLDRLIVKPTDPPPAPAPATA